MKKQSWFTSVELAIVVIVLVGVGGWVANIVKLTGESFDPITAMAVIRSIGVFVAPLGSVLGFI